MHLTQKKVKQVIEPDIVTEGAGVKLKRSIGTTGLNYLDPFLLFDHFASRQEEDYSAGFPMHPHRGIETVTYVLAGEVRHRDTLGNSGTIGAGDVQWMTAGGGLLHEEMPQIRPEGIAGFQLWVNLPASQKMIQPRYQDFKSKEIPTVGKKGGLQVRVIAGMFDGITGPIQGIAANPNYLDVSLPGNMRFTHSIPRGHSAFAYVFEGEAGFGEGSEGAIEHSLHPRLVVWEDGDEVTVITKEQSVRFLLVSGQPLHEPIARYGPFVMNTKEEIEEALYDLKQGTFIWSEKSKT